MFSNAPPRAEFAPACHYGIALAAVATKQELQLFSNLFQNKAISFFQTLEHFGWESVKLILL